MKNNNGYKGNGFLLEVAGFTATDDLANMRKGNGFLLEVAGFTATDDLAK